MSPRVKRKNRTLEQFRFDILTVLGKENGLSRLEIARSMKLSKSPHFLRIINNMVEDGLLIVVKRWTSNRKRYELSYWAVPMMDFQIYQAYARDGRGIPDVYHDLMVEYYIEANGGLLGKYNFTRSEHLACPLCTNEAVIIHWDGKRWIECMQCGFQCPVDTYGNRLE